MDFYNRKQLRTPVRVAATRACTSAHSVQYRSTVKKRRWRQAMLKLKSLVDRQHIQSTSRSTELRVATAWRRLSMTSWAIA